MSANDASTFNHRALVSRSMSIVVPSLASCSSGKCLILDVSSVQRHYRLNGENKTCIRYHMRADWASERLDQRSHSIYSGLFIPYLSKGQQTSACFAFPARFENVTIYVANGSIGFKSVTVTFVNSIDRSIDEQRSTVYIKGTCSTDYSSITSIRSNDVSLSTVEQNLSNSTITDASLDFEYSLLLVVDGTGKDLLGRYLLLLFRKIDLLLLLPRLSVRCMMWKFLWRMVNRVAMVLSPLRNKRIALRAIQSMDGQVINGRSMQVRDLNTALVKIHLPLFD